VPEPAYPYQRRGYARFLRECQTSRENGVKFTCEFESRYLQESWRKYTRKDYQFEIGQIYQEANKPGIVSLAIHYGLRFLRVGVETVGSMLVDDKDIRNVGEWTTVDEFPDSVDPVKLLDVDRGRWTPDKITTFLDNTRIGDIGDDHFLHRNESLSPSCSSVSDFSISVDSCEGCVDLQSGWGGENQECHMGVGGCLEE
jgi:hypothetical protein